MAPAYRSPFETRPRGLKHLGVVPLSASCVILWTTISLLLTSCTALTRAKRPAIYAHKITTDQHHTPGDATSATYADYVGVIHVHTTYSHDAHGTFEEVVRAANGQGLDYAIITEHNTLQPLRDGKQGWHGATLVLIGVEISTRAGHYLALNVTNDIDHEHLTTQQIIDEVNRQGGFGFIAHPYFKHGRWRDWSVTGFTGIETYNVAHDTLDENKFRLALWTVTAPVEPFYASIITRSYDPLAKWDELIRLRGHIVGIGSTDAHEFHLMGLVFAPYDVLFRMSRTHLLIPSQPLTAQAIYDALRAGHAYLSIELMAEAKGFTFEAWKDRKRVGIMGDDVVWTPMLHLQTSLPAPALMTLFRDGQPIATETNTAWDVPVAQPGVYRLEVTRNGKPWIFSNPIYVTPAQTTDGTAHQPDVSQTSTNAPH